MSKATSLSLHEAEAKARVRLKTAGASRTQTVEIVRRGAAAPAVVHSAILDGFQIREVKKVAAGLGISAEDMAARLGISRTTYHRHLEAERTLDPLQADVLAKYTVLLTKAAETFDGDEEAAREWLKTPQPGLGDGVPLELARTTVGFREVEKLLTRIDHGVYA